MWLNVVRFFWVVVDIGGLILVIGLLVVKLVVLIVVIVIVIISFFMIVFYINWMCLLNGNL